MTPDPFASSILSTVLSWLLAISVLLILVGGILAAAFRPVTARVKILWAWMALCALALTPVRYMLFQVIAAMCYPWQSVRALLSTFILSLYVPIIFFLLVAVTILVPVFITFKIAGATERPPLTRLAVAALVFPILCVLGSWIYYGTGLPLGARSIYWLHPVDVMRAANGPAYLTFKYIGMPLTPLSFPVPGEELPGSDLALLRLHVASMYLSPKKEAWVMMTAYPELYRQEKERRKKE